MKHVKLYAERHLKGNVHISIQRVGGGFSLCFLRFLSDSSHVDLNCDLVFKQKPKWGKTNFFPLMFPAFSLFLKKNFVLGLCGVSEIMNIGSGNSILDYIAFPPLLIPFPPPHFPAFPPPKWRNGIRRGGLSLLSHSY